MSSAFPGGRHLIQQALQVGDVPDCALDICMASVTLSTLKQYDSGLKLWWQYCQDKKLDVFSFSIPMILEFFTELFNKGASYGSLNSYRSAMAQVFGPSISQDFRMKRFFRGVYHLRPSKPRYENTWDPTLVLDYLRSLENNKLSLENLSYKLAMLLALSTGQRVQTISVIELANIRKCNDGIEIKITQRIKTSSLNRPQPVLSLPFYPTEPNICVATTLLFYIEKTSSFRNNSNCNYLLLTFKKPFHNASSQTISRWIKRVMTESGIDVSSFSSHSTRHASTSRAHRKGISYEIIRSAAGWSSNSRTFANFYNRPLRDPYSFAKSVLET